MPDEQVMKKARLVDASLDDAVILRRCVDEICMTRQHSPNENNIFAKIVDADVNHHIDREQIDLAGNMFEETVDDDDSVKVNFDLDNRTNR